jgi:carbon storage regulator CsrA
MGVLYNGIFPNEMSYGRPTMLVLTLKENEAVIIGKNIRVMVVKILAGKQVRLGIEAPPELLVLREGERLSGRGKAREPKT